MKLKSFICQLDKLEIVVNGSITETWKILNLFNIKKKSKLTVTMNGTIVNLSKPTTAKTVRIYYDV